MWTCQVIEELGDLGGEAMDRFEMTGGEEEEVLRLLASLVMEMRDKDVVEGVMKVWKQEKEVDAVWEELLRAGAEQLKGQSENVIVSEPMKLLEQISQLISPSILSRHLVPLAREEMVDVADRLALVGLLKDLDVKEDEGESVLDSSQLANLYQTQHDIQKILPSFTVTETDLTSTQSKQNLLEKLLAGCEGVLEVEQVAEVAKDWELDSWLFTVVNRLLQLDHGTQSVVELLVGNDLDETRLSEEEAEELLKLGEADGLAGAMLILSLGLESSYPRVVQVKSESKSLLVNQKQVQVLQEEESCSYTLALLIVKRKLVAALAMRPILSALVNVCLEEEGGQQLLENVVRQLREAGQHPLAASIQVGNYIVVPELITRDSCRCKWRGFQPA